jgi:hypothetical protein
MRDSRALWLAAFRLTRNRLEDGDRHRLNRRHSGDFSHRDRVRLANRGTGQRGGAFDGCCRATAHNADRPTLALDGLRHHLNTRR